MDYATFQRSQRSRLVYWVLGLSVVALVALVALRWQPEAAADSRARAAAGVDQYSAAALCETAIKGASLNATTARVPHVRAIDGGARWRFVWLPAARLQLQNQFGAMIDTTATCEIDKGSGTVAALEIAGESAL